MSTKHRPGRIRDAIFQSLRDRPDGANIAQIHSDVAEAVGRVAESSIRSYLRLNTPTAFSRLGRGRYALRDDVQASRVSEIASPQYLGAVEDSSIESFRAGRAKMYLCDCMEWFRGRQENSIHAVVTDPPYGLLEYRPDQQLKLRNGKGGVWRIPPSFDGAQRAPLPRFTVLTSQDLAALETFFLAWGRAMLPVLTPGANVVVASNPLLSHLVAGALSRAGLERRGEIVRLVMTMRGGDRPKAAHEEFREVSVMPRSMWEPWLLFRKPLEARVQDNLRKWKTGGFRRPSEHKPFGDVVPSAPTNRAERAIAAHPSLKPQAFLRHVVRGVLPLGEGVVLDPFAGSGSTLAAANAIGYSSVGVERDPHYFNLARNSIARLAEYRNGGNYEFDL